MSASDPYLILKLYGVALIGGWRLKKEDTYFKLRGIIHVKFSSLSHSKQ